MYDEECILEAAAGGLSLTGHFHKKQRRIYNDPSGFRVVIGGRRSGKTTEFGAEALEIADQFPGGETCVPYLALTITKAMDVMLPQMRKLEREQNIKLGYLLGDGKVITPNGGVIQMGGLNSKHDVEKGRSGSYPMLIIDECGAQRKSLLKRALTETYGPATKDWLGKGGRGVLLGGTPDYEPRSYWYQLCGGNDHESEYAASVHHMTIFDNPFYAGREMEVIDTYCLENNITIDSPVVQREWYGLFCHDSDGLAFPSWNGIELPFSAHPQAGQTVIGLDIGSDQPCAWVVVRFDLVETLRGTAGREFLQRQFHAHVLESYEESDLTVHDVAAITKTFQQNYNASLTVGDSGGGGKLTIDSINQNMGVPIKPVNKTVNGSRLVEDRIWFADSMFATGTLWIYDRAQTLAEQLRATPKERGKNGLLNFMAGYPDHSLDALLYALIAAQQHEIIRELPPEPGSRAALEKEMREGVQRIVSPSNARQRVLLARRAKSRR